MYIPFWDIIKILLGGRKMKQKLLSALLCVSMVAAMLTGCGESKPSTTDDAAANNATDNVAVESTEETTGTDEEMLVYLVSKGFQHQFWQAVYQGALEAAANYGVKMEMVGPPSESDIQEQVQMLNNAINLKPAAIGLAALDTEACIDLIKVAQDAEIPIIGFDSGVPNAPEGAVCANAATDNYAAGELAAEETYKLIESKIADATAPVRIGVMSQDATAESILNRGYGFVDKMKSLVEATGKTVSIEGHTNFVDKCGGTVADADVVIEVVVPAAVQAELSVADGSALLNKKDIIAVYASNQFSGEGLVNADANLHKLGADGVIGVAFDSGKVIKDAVKSGTLAGAVTQDPVSIGYKTVELAVKAAKGEAVSDVDTGCKWYTAENMEDEDIAPNLYD